MKKFPTIVLALVLVAVFVLPAPASATTSAGIKPGSFFYFFDTTFEKIGMFFTFSPEKKARKALEYADERLAEAEAVTDNAEAVKTAITNYESNIAFAEEKSRDIEDKEKAEALLTSIADNTSKHQDVLADVLAKVPDEAKEAITRAIEASRKGHVEAIQKIAELKGEVDKLKQEVAELKAKNEQRQADEVEKLKKEVEELKKKQTAPAPIQKNTEPVKQENKSEPIKTQSNKEDNFWESTVTMNAKFRETAREYKEVISENPYHFQSRLDELDANIRVIRNTYFTNPTGDEVAFNKMFKLLEDSYQSERTYVQNVLDNTKKGMGYFDNMIAYYDKKVNDYLKLPVKFVSAETWIADTEAYTKSQSDAMYKVMSVSIEDFGNFVDNMKKKDKVYYDAVTLIKSSLENYSSSYSSYTPPAPKTDYSYYDRITNDLYSKPSILNPITCNISGRDVLGGQTVTCY